MIEDKLLISGIQRGQQEALRQVYDKYRTKLLKLAVVLTGDVHTAEDVVQDAFMGFCRTIHGLKHSGSLRSYLVTSVINRVRSLRRDRLRRPEEKHEQVESITSQEKNPQQWAILSEQLVLLSRAMTQLPYEQREVISLRMQTGMTLRQIAVVQQTSINTVKGRYRYGIDKLRSLLNGELSP